MVYTHGTNSLQMMPRSHDDGLMPANGAMGRSVSGMVAEARSMHDVREARVAELRERISSGTYIISAHAVANKMVEGLLNPL